jgi:phosphocarrier protein
MREFNYVITDEVGLHARPAGMLVKKVNEYTSKVTLFRGEKSADAGKLMAVMSLGIKKGDTVRVRVEGEDEAAAAVQIEEFFKNNL